VGGNLRRQDCDNRRVTEFVCECSSPMQSNLVWTPRAATWLHSSWRNNNESHFGKRYYLPPAAYRPFLQNFIASLTQAIWRWPIPLHAVYVRLHEELRARIRFSILWHGLGPLDTKTLMKEFFVGLHQPSDAKHFERCCIHVGRLKSRRKALGCLNTPPRQSGVSRFGVAWRAPTVASRIRDGRRHKRSFVTNGC
jgi:hypothetical protein